MLTDPDDIWEQNASRHQPGGQTDEVDLPSSKYPVMVVVLEIVATTFSKTKIISDVFSAL